MGSRSKRPFVPTEYVVPRELVTANFTLRMLSVDDVEKDFEAVMSSAARLSQVWPGSGWPAGLTLRQNLIEDRALVLERAGIRQALLESSCFAPQLIV